MLTDVSVIDFAMWMFANVFLTGFPCPGVGDGMKASQENGFGSSISPRYLNIYAVIHIYPFTGAAFWV